MITSPLQYVVVVDKLKDLRKYLNNMDINNTPPVVIKAIESQLKQLIKDLEQEIYDYEERDI